MRDSLPATEQVNEANEPRILSRHPYRWLTRTFNEGHTNFANLSAYAFGLSGLWTGTGSVIQQIKVQQIVENNSISLFGLDLDKAGTLGLVSLTGLAVAAMVQPISGVLSDRGSGSWGKRLPFIFVGAIGLSVATFGFGAAASIASLLIAVVLMQVFGNMSQGPANALIVDNVPVGQMGEASGALNFARVLGAGILTILVLFMMANYDNSNGDVWLWASISLMVVVLLVSTLWTVLSLKSTVKRKTPPPLSPEPIVRELGRWARRREALLVLRNRRTYFFFLVAMTFVIAAMSAMQVYALFFMEDVVGLANPARDTGLVVMVIAVSTLAVVIPAGSMADRVGHERLIVIAGLLGSLGAILLLFVQSLVGALLVAIVIGFAVGIFLSVTWALANTLVPRMTAARDLGWTGVATFVGAAAARLAGLGIDALNERATNLGYNVIIIGVAAAFLLSSFMMVRVSGSSRDRARARAWVRTAKTGDDQG